jgi:hypothetical protein
VTPPPVGEPLLRRAHAAAPVARLRAHPSPAPPPTARRAASAGRARPAGRGTTLERPHVSAAALGVWATPTGRDAATGLGPCCAAPAGLGPTGPRGPRPRGALGRPDPGAVTGLRAAGAPPALVVPGSRPADAAPGHHPPADLDARGAPAWPRPRRLASHAAALLGPASLRAGCVGARPPSTPWPPASAAPRARHAADAQHLRRRAGHHHRPQGRPRTALGPGPASGGRRLPVRWFRRSGAGWRGSPAPSSPCAG